MNLKNILQISRFKKTLILIICDLSLSFIATYLSIIIRFENFAISNLIDSYYVFLIPVIIYIPLFYFFGLYKNIVRFIGLETFKQLYIVAFFYICLFSMFLIISPIYLLPRSLGFIQAIIFFVMVILSRIIFITLINEILKNVNKENILICGSDGLAVKTAEAISHSDLYKLEGFIDLSNENIGNKINGKNIYSINSLNSVIKNFKISTVLITENKNHLNFKKAIQKLEDYDLKLKYLPDVDRFIEGNITINDFKHFELNDLIERKSYFDAEIVRGLFTNKIVLITGAGGSIGSELSLQILQCEPRKIIFIDNNEYRLYQLEKILIDIQKNKNLKTELIFELASIRDKNRINGIFKSNIIDFVYHVAAYKHVPLLEKNIYEPVTNNIFGSLNVINLSVEYNIDHFILISSDKAVRPTNIMGVSKRIVEMIVQSYSRNKKINNIKMSIVRFGNVLDSSGSVLPLFRYQIKNKLPITVTDPRVTRYFMTITEAVNLIIQTNLLFEKNGEVFVLDMGKPIRVLDLAKKVISLSGLKEKTPENPNGDIEIKFIGLRPGEKLYEELFLGDNLKSTKNKKILRADEESLSMHKINELINSLEKSVINQDANSIIKYLIEYVPEYKIR